jgi:hypothetical protein
VMHIIYNNNIRWKCWLARPVRLVRNFMTFHFLLQHCQRFEQFSAPTSGLKEGSSRNILSKYSLKQVWSILLISESMSIFISMISQTKASLSAVVIGWITAAPEAEALQGRVHWRQTQRPWQNESARFGPSKLINADSDRQRSQL